MSRRIRHLSAVLLALTLVSGCGRPDRPAAQNSDDPVDAAHADRAARDVRHLVMAGQLRSIDRDKQRVIIAVGEDLYEFSYSDSTEVVGGTSGVQGLTGRTGNAITVEYRESPITSTKTAVRFELP